MLDLVMGTMLLINLFKILNLKNYPFYDLGLNKFLLTLNIFSFIIECFLAFILLFDPKKISLKYISFSFVIILSLAFKIGKKLARKFLIGRIKSHPDVTFRIILVKINEP